MVKVYPIASGSSGNAYYIGDNNSGIIVDAGVSCKSILSALGDIGLSQNVVQGIFITHEHSDHVKGLKVLSRKLQVPVYASAPTLEALITQGNVESTTTLMEINEETSIADMSVLPFRTPHDVPHSLGFRITSGERIIGFATDVGKANDTVMAGLSGSHLAIIESNYEESLLAVSPYPFFLKERIRSDYGHLSNKDCGKCISTLALGGTSRFILGHLSRDNNAPYIAKQQAELSLTSIGMTNGKDYLLTVANRLDPTKPTLL